MSKIKFELNREGVREMLRSAAIQGVCSEYASSVLNQCGEGYATNTRVGKNRVYCSVYPDTIHAHFSNLKHNTLLKALGGAKQ